MLDRYRLYDFLTTRGRNAILEWVKDERLSSRDRAMLNQKFRRLAQVEYQLAIETKLLSGPIYKNIYKLVIHGQVMMRPMLCRGPRENEAEYTILLGTTERDWKLPKGAMEQADQRRTIIENDFSRRCIHEHIPNQ
ncbi:MAG TPA: hypothetical protein DCK93_09280 [Blastocatellia bacterium]|nr:hypothetical protein [Blastocatellia bacterium]